MEVQRKNSYWWIYLCTLVLLLQLAIHAEETYQIWHQCFCILFAFAAVFLGFGVYLESEDANSVQYPVGVVEMLVDTGVNQARGHCT